MILSSCLLAAAVLQDPVVGEGERLVRRMESALAEGKSLQVSFGVELAGAGKARMKGRLVTQGALKLRMETEVQPPADGAGAPAARQGLFLLSNGPVLRLRRNDGTNVDRPTPPEFARHVRSMVASGGIAMMTVSVSSGPKTGETFDIDIPRSVLSDFSKPASEKLEGREVSVVDYVSKIAGLKFACRVWIDPKTGLPLKRTLDGGGMKMTETFGETTIDGEIDPATFELKP